MTSFVDILPSLKGKDVYFHLNKNNPDWLGSCEDLDLLFHYDGRKMILPLHDLDEVSYLTSSLYHVIDEKNILLSWDSKDVFSFLKRRTGISLEVHSSVYDLSLISSYLGINAERPETFKESISLLKTCLSDSNWDKFSSFYYGVFEPLLSRVIPDIEACCLVDNEKRACVYPTYVMEGQANGRLSTVKVNNQSYNPHSIGPEEKQNLRPKDYEQVFLYMDYKNMEVNVLQWLSGDERLLSILNSGRDLYKEIWKKITKQEPTDAHRKLCKDIFLPVVFGQGKFSLSKKLGVSEEIASRLIHSLSKTFHVAFDWVKSQSADGNNMAIDAFGRKRIFNDQEHYKVKNFCIQSPASMICLRKLVRLHDALAGKANICFHVHDGYCILCNKNEINSIAEIGKKALEEEDPMFPGLNLKVICQQGYRLDDMQTLTTKEVSV